MMKQIRINNPYKTSQSFRRMLDREYPNRIHQFTFKCPFTHRILGAQFTINEEA